MRINIKVDVQAAFSCSLRSNCALVLFLTLNLKGEKMAKELDISIWIANRSEWADFCWIFQLDEG